MLNEAQQTTADSAIARAYPTPAHERRYSEAFRFRELPFRDIALLRAAPDTPGLTQATADLTGAALPLSANTVSVSEAYTICWLGPDEWLIHSRQPQMPVLEAAFGSLAASQFVSSVDVGSGYTIFEISGMRAREVLQKGCPLDLHPQVLQVGHCAQSHYFKAGVLLKPISPNSYELVVRRSFADYFYRIMLTAAEEFLQ